MLFVPCGLARPKGLEPLTYWFVASHSIQLSYERISFSYWVLQNSASL